MPQSDTTGNTTDKIRAGQKQILEQLAGYEDALAELYAAFAKHLPAHSDLWSRMSAEELSHGRMLRGLEKMLERGFLFYNIGRFDLKLIEEAILKLQEVRKTAKSDGISIRNACTIASEAEASVLDGQFFKIVESDSPEFQIIAKHLAAATEKHALQVRNLIVSLMAPATASRSRK